MGFFSAKDKSVKKQVNYDQSFTTVLFTLILPLYDSIEKRILECAISKLLKFVFNKVGFLFSNFRRAFAGAFENSSILNSAKGFFVRIFEKSLRYYGVALFFFGFFHLAITLISEMSRFGNNGILTHSNFFVILPGIMIVVVAAVMMVSQKSLAMLILQSRVISFVLFDILNFDRKYFEKIKLQSRSHTLPVIVGMLLGISSIFYSPLSLLKSLAILICIIAVMKSPENGIIAICLVFPFVNQRVLLIALGLVSFSYFIKVLRFKRVFKFGLMDASISILSAVILFCGLKSVDVQGSIKTTVCVLLCLLFGFILSNTMRTSRLVSKCFNSLLISASVTSFFAILSFVVSRYDLKSLNAFTEIVFNYPASFPLGRGGDIFEILVLFIPLALSKRNEKGITAGSNGLVSFLLIVGAVAVSFDTSVWFTAAIVTVIYICFIRPSLFTPSFIGSAIILTLAGLFPKTVSTISRFLGNVIGIGFDFQGVAYSNSVGLNLIYDSSLCGFGVGGGAIENAISYYYGSGACGVSENISLILRTILELGVFGVIAVVLVYVTFFVYSFGIYFNEKIISQYKSYVAAALASVSAVCVKGLIFPASMSLQSILIICIFLYACTCIKQSAINEFVPKDAAFSGENY